MKKYSEQTEEFKEKHKAYLRAYSKRKYAELSKEEKEKRNKYYRDLRASKKPDVPIDVLMTSVLIREPLLFQILKASSHTQVTRVLINKYNIPL